MMKALVVSLSAPEMDHLAVELCRRAALVGLVRRYANKQRWWEQGLARVPMLGSAYASTLGRRHPPAGVDGRLLQEAGVASDFIRAVVNRAGRSVPDLVGGLSKRLLACTESGIARTGMLLAGSADVVVASYHIAGPAFMRARDAGRRTVLNYPIAHHRWQYRFFAEQARLNPEFAAALPRFGSQESHAAVLDREIDMADLILVGSGFVRDTFVSEGIAADRLRVIPYGADAQRFSPSAVARQPDRPFRVLFIGQIGERKGVSHLLKAYEQFRKQDTELHLVGDFVGSGEVYRSYRNLFRHTPNVPQAQLPALFREADVFVLPTLVEGMPMVVLEAMACGLPVIASPHGPAEVVRDGLDGFIVPVCDSAAIVERLERLYADRTLCREMGRNARARAEQWSWQRYASTAADAVLQQ